MGVEDRALEADTAGSAFAAFAAGRSAIIGTGVRITVIGGRIVHRSEG